MSSSKVLVVARGQNAADCHSVDVAEHDGWLEFFRVLVSFFKMIRSVFLGP